MLQNYLKLNWRIIVRNPLNSFINIAGLATGIASVILIVLYVQDELRYDRFFTGIEQVYQVNMTGTDNGVRTITGNTAPAVGPALLQSFAEVAAYTRIYRPGDIMVGAEEQFKTPVSFTEKGVMAVDSNFLQVFNYPLLTGDAATCLGKPNSVVITKTTAIRYFGTTRALGKTLLFGTEQKPFEVTAVLADLPAQSSFRFDLLAPVQAYAEVKKRSWNWFWLQVNTYVQLKKNIAADKSAVSKLETKFPAFVKEHAFRRKAGSYDEFIKKGNRMGYSLMPFTSVHLHAAGLGVNARLTTLGSITYVYIFSVIALFIILLACVNFINLSTAQSAARAKEVGIRKVLGSRKGALIWQFLTEALLYSYMAGLVAVLLVAGLAGPFNAITGKSLSFGHIFSGYIWMGICLLCLLTGLLAGLYPAFYLTSFNAADVLKGMKSRANAYFGNLFIRNGLVVFQFSISIALIICTLVVYRQLTYIRTRDLGFSREHVIIIANTDRLKSSEETFRRSLGAVPGVISASVTSSIPTRVNFADIYVPEAAAGDKPLITEIELSSFVVDNWFIPAYRMQLLQGRNFAPDFPDSASVIINETAAAMIGWKDAVGKWLGYPGNNQRFKVIGVVRDFNVSSLHEPVAPFALFHAASHTYNLGHSYMTVRVAGGQSAKYVRTLATAWRQFAPAAPFDYSFLDDEYDALYRSEQRMGTVFGIFTSLSIFVACMGLFGLSVYTVQRRRKEIGVRKLLGASVSTVVLLLTRDFLRLLLVSAFIAFPLAWVAMNRWLDDFAYRIPIGWSVFAFAGLGALVLALLTTSFHAVRAARANPVSQLHTE